MHMYAFNRGLKTGIYYLRRKAKHQAQQFTLEPARRIGGGGGGGTSPSHQEENTCESCSA
jgi:hypothetical protein